MSEMVDQIRAAMSTPVLEDDGVHASFLFGADFVGFQGHFPGRPILPAVCSVQAALLVLEAHFHHELRLCEIERARFSAPATCNECIDFRCTLKSGKLHGDQVVRVSVSRSGETVARLRLRIAHEGVDA